MHKIFSYTLLSIFFLLFITCEKFEIKYSTKIETLSATAGVTSISAQGKIIDLSDEKHAEHGFCYSDQRNSTVEDGKVSFGSPKIGQFTGAIKGLEMGTTYYIKAYCKEGESYKYGEERTVTTANVEVTTSDISNITRTTATAGGTIAVTGTVTVSERGICWNTSPNPTVKGFHLPVSEGTGNYSSQLSDLVKYTTYYVKAYAIAGVDTILGDQKSFTTLNVSVADIVTKEITSITSGTAISGGEITSDGGEEVTARGVCWSISQNPTTVDEHTTDGSGVGLYSSNIVDLDPGTTYHVRAYATNAVGTAYGDDLSFTTDAVLPTITTTTVTGVTSNAALSGGNITSDGGASISERGVCWSTSLNPTITDSKTSDGTGAGEFTSSISGLNHITTYHVRAFATNSVGTAYGEDITFTTSALLPTISTSDISSITSNTASSGGNVTSDGGASVTAKGVCWSTNQNPTADGSHTSDGAGTGSFTSSITGLSPATTYYVRAYATNSMGTAYGSELTFTTSVGLPVISTTSASSITSTTAASGGNVTSDGGATVTARGVCWSTSMNPSLTDNYTTDESGTGTFTSSITGLTPGTHYYVRAYATNSAGTSYGVNITFTTTAVLPILSSTSPSSVTASTAISGGNITYDGGATVTARGVCWGTSDSPTTNNSHTVDGSGTGTFISSITGLLPVTTYYVRAYATNSIGTAYGDVVTLTTIVGYPVVSTTAISDITSTTATSGGNITSDGGGAVSARGVCWSTTSNPTLSNSFTTDGDGTGSFISNISGLIPGTTYYVRAYATNSAGTSYGSEVTFATSAVLPVLSTSTVTNITGISATCGGTISFDGGAIVTSRGVCYSTNENPTLSDSYTSDGSGSGSFVSNLTGLDPGVSYYIRAYATNSVGTVYGEQVTFTTSIVVPTVTTTAITDITSTTVTAGGNVTSGGGVTVTARGICWGTTENPTLSDSFTTEGDGIGTFTTSLTGLIPGTTYHVRAYATNSEGTAYGSDISFTTNAMMPTITTTEASIITTATASTGGNVTYNGGAAVTARGVCWSTLENPTLSDSKIYSGSGDGSFTCDLTGLSSGTTYHVRAFATNSVGTSYGEDVSFTTLVALPSVTTTVDYSKIAITTAVAGGEVSSDGGGVITARGVCWSTTANPTIANSFTTETGELGVFTSTLTGLSALTSYYVRAYATNSAGTSYGNSVVIATFKADAVSDYDGNYYNTVTIGSQVWMQSNLKTTHYNNGEEITLVENSSAWTALTYGGYCWYDNDEKYKTYLNHYYSYGALYNVYAIVDSRNICPSGWHVPSDAEWSTLETYLGGTSVAGGKLKATWTDYNGSTEGWSSPNTSADNSSLFFALPGGFRVGYNGNFVFRKQYSMFGTSSETYHDQSYNEATSTGTPSAYKTHGYSVRCVKN